MPPDEFEKSRKGDCEDFAVYAWRQLQELGYKARFVAGALGDDSRGHAWVTFEDRGKHFLLEPQLACSTCNSRDSTHSNTNRKSQ